jgi:membrane-bound serine protease (ClpP class)
MRRGSVRPVYHLLLLVLLFMLSSASINDEGKKVLVFKFNIKEEIAAPAWRLTQEAFREAREKGAKIIIIDMNTYGGLVDKADSIRTKILNSDIPVYVFIDDNAASAGALISIACDSIYMKNGAKIGAATVVNQTGEAMPDKYQSYMRATMRATAEAHGGDTIMTNRDTTFRWHRDPRIAEGMVDPSIYIPGISDSGKVITFTAEEAVRFGYCEGIVKDIPGALKKAGIDNYELVEYSPTVVDSLIHFLLNPIVHGLLIMLIIGGIYFELQTPGIGFPLGLAIVAAVLYFAPLYLEGLAQNWELLVFILGLGLLALEIFAIPGFGVAGATGIVLILIGLTMAMVDNFVFDTGDLPLILNTILRSFSIVIVSFVLSLVISLLTAQQLFSRGVFSKLTLKDVQRKEEGFLGVEGKYSSLVGKKGVTHTVLRPSGMVEIDGDYYDAKAEFGYLPKGTNVTVIRYETGQLVVEETELPG